MPPRLRLPSRALAQGTEQDRSARADAIAAWLAGSAGDAGGGPDRLYASAFLTDEGKIFATASPPKARSPPAGGRRDPRSAEARAAARSDLDRLRPRGWRNPRRRLLTLGDGDARALRPAQGKPCRARLRGSDPDGAPICWRRRASRPGCCSSSMAASTISWSTRPRTPTPRNGRSSRLLAEEFFVGEGARRRPRRARAPSSPWAT